MDCGFLSPFCFGFISIPPSPAPGLLWWALSTFGSEAFLSFHFSVFRIRVLALAKASESLRQLGYC